MAEIEAEFVGHEQCPECNSKDNLARYSDGHGYCFGCEHWEPPEGEHATLEKNDLPVTRDRDSSSLITGEYRALSKRGITEETCRFFGYQVGEFQGKSVHIAPFFTDGKLVAQKLRDSGKNFKVLGDGKRLPLFGQDKWRGSGRRIIITEGELDCLSVSQLQGNKWPVVSLPNGAGGGTRAIAGQLAFLEGYEQVIFAFDMDEPGQKAARECAAMLAPGKAYIADLPFKDANECLIQHAGKALLNSLWEAKPFRPDGIVGVEEILEDAIKPVEVGLDWPWATLTEKTYGRRRSELYAFGGGTGCGKSTVFKQVAKHIVEHDKLPVGMIMLEEQPAHTLKTLGGMFMGARVHVPEVVYDVEVLRRTLTELAGKVSFYRHFGSSDWETIKDKIRYMVRAEGIKDIFLDHLTAVAASIQEQDERKAIDRIMAELSALTQELNCTIYFISHLTTPDGTPHEEGGRVLEKQFRGSRSIGYWSHFMFGIERDKQDLSGLTTFRVLKDRYTGDSNGVTFGLRYDTATGLLDECVLPAKKSKGQSDGSEFDVGDY